MRHVQRILDRCVERGLNGHLANQRRTPRAECAGNCEGLDLGGRIGAAENPYQSILNLRGIRGDVPSLGRLRDEPGHRDTVPIRRKLPSVVGALERASALVDTPERERDIAMRATVEERCYT